MNLDGTNVTRMTRADCLPDVVDFDWAPSGSSLVFAGFTCEFHDCGTQIFGASVPDGAPTLLAEAFLELDLPGSPARVSRRREESSTSAPTTWPSPGSGR